jgi:hypothetical protein
MEAYIMCWLRALPPEQRNSPDRAPNSALWQALFQEEWRNAITKFDIGAPTHTRYNITIQCAWWSGRNVEDVLHEYGYMSEYRRFAPMRVATWSAPTPARSASRSSGSSDSRALCPLPSAHTPTRQSRHQGARRWVVFIVTAREKGGGVKEEPQSPRGFLRFRRPMVKVK